ncbi:hypothetical protein BVC80_1679g21 [Macleaya cordata]|uniref:Uncharacterized protein n=1 Tax=Macleaya cordata TaxID=56857 RepID=A0A200Q0S5_MACCD|nr:hypothetical protein BVC80_1679g21 [Macleaya cordata]
MASSSSSPNPLVVVEEEADDWLELGLGVSVVRQKNELRLNSGSTSRSESSHHQISSHRFQLGLGFQNEGVDNDLADENLVSGLASIRPHHTTGKLHAGYSFNLEKQQGAGDDEDYDDQLPQITKAYVRVKDEEEVTIFMVKTYLVTKLGLSNEAQEYYTPES